MSYTLPSGQSLSGLFSSWLHFAHILRILFAYYALPQWLERRSLDIGCQDSPLRSFRRQGSLRRAKTAKLCRCSAVRYLWPDWVVSFCLGHRSSWKNRQGKVGKESVSILCCTNNGRTLACWRQDKQGKLEDLQFLILHMRNRAPLVRHEESFTKVVGNGEACHTACHIWRILQCSDFCKQRFVFSSCFLCIVLFLVLHFADFAYVLHGCCILWSIMLDLWHILLLLYVCIYIYMIYMNYMIYVWHIFCILCLDSARSAWRSLMAQDSPGDRATHWPPRWAPVTLHSNAAWWQTNPTQEDLTKFI